MDEIIRRDEILPLHIDELREYIFSYVPLSIQSQVVDMIVSGVNEAAEEKKKQYSLNTDIPRYKTELFCIVTMIDLVVSNHIRELDMPQIPKILRTHITSRLRHFTGLQYLDLLLLGFGKDSRNVGIEEIVAPSNIIEAVRGMEHLTHVILPTFCTNNLIAALAKTCKDSLKRLEIDHCENVTDVGVDHLLRLENLELLSLADTSIGTPALARGVFGLKKLRHLLNAEFLVDVLEFVVYEDQEIWEKGSSCPTLNILEFSCSEVYYFHTTKQMELAAQMCPHVRHVSFFYDGELTCQLAVLNNFTNLTHLKLNGGDLNKDPLRQFVEGVSRKLEQLDLNHVENIDRQFIFQICLSCPELTRLSFCACSFVDYGLLHRDLFEYYNSGGIDTIEEIELALLLRDQEEFSNEVESIMTPFLKLEELTISSICSRKNLVFLLTHTPNIVRLTLGSNTGVTDEILLQVLAENPMERLEFLNLQGGADLTYSSLELLTATCCSLRTVKGLPYWYGVTPEQREQFEEWIKENNMDLDVSEMEPLDYSLFHNRFELDERQKEELRIFFSTD